MIYVTQWLCPQHHCSIGFLWEEASDTQEGIVARGEDLFEKGVVRRACGICGSRELTPKHQRTRFASIDEAMPTFKRLQAANLVAQDILGDPTPVDLTKIEYPNLIDNL